MQFERYKNITDRYAATSIDDTSLSLCLPEQNIYQNSESWKGRQIYKKTSNTF